MTLIKTTIGTVLLIVGVNIVAAPSPGHWSLVGGACLGAFAGMAMYR